MWAVSSSMARGRSEPRSGFVRYPCEGFLLNTGWEIPHSLVSEPTGNGTMDAVHFLSICAIVTVASPVGLAVSQGRLWTLVSLLGGFLSSRCRSNHMLMVSMWAWFRMKSLFAIGLGKDIELLRWLLAGTHRRDWVYQMQSKPTQYDFTWESLTRHLD